MAKKKKTGTEELFERFFSDLKMKGLDGFYIRDRIWMPKDIPEEIKAKCPIPDDGNSYQVVGCMVELMRHNKPQVCMYHVLPYKTEVINEAIEKNNYDLFVPRDMVADFKDQIAMMLMNQGLYIIVQQNQISGR